jgi:hypothetical protein
MASLAVYLAYMGSSLTTSTNTLVRTVIAPCINNLAMSAKSILDCVASSTIGVCPGVADVASDLATLALNWSEGKLEISGEEHIKTLEQAAGKISPSLLTSAYWLPGNIMSGLTHLMNGIASGAIPLPAGPSTGIGPVILPEPVPIGD